jgi:hypothetical protein
MIITRLKLKNWRNFKKLAVVLRERAYVTDPIHNRLKREDYHGHC